MIMKNDAKNSISMERVQKDLKLSIGDYGHASLNAGVTTIFSILFPPFAPIFSAVFGTVILPPPISKRLNDLLFDIVKGLNELKQMHENFEIEDLAQNESFLTTLIHAYELAIRTHQKEKLEALRNAVLNSALPTAPEDDIKIIFLNLIESFTVTHIKLLKFFNERRSKYWIDNLTSKIDYNFDFAGYSFRDDVSVKVMTFEFGDVMATTFPDYIEKNMLYQYALKDLDSQGMVIRDPGDTTFRVIPIDGHSDPQVQPFGKQFMEFIESPLK